MLPRRIQFVLIGTWVFVAVVVVVYPLLSGQLRVGTTAVRRDSDPEAYWRGYWLSTLLFIGVSAVAAGVVRTLLR